MKEASSKERSLASKHIVINQPEHDYSNFLGKEINAESDLDRPEGSNRGQRYFSILKLDNYYSYYCQLL
jgi:hypothetical protein